ncbi:acyl-CoA dehydrogenase family protein [Nocardioides convexus]|uniref:acyl-CoA dehydrogenase family protein n=1 Tax=Nocardioides convexus TaxID=2712224 RepID=UPI0031016111
MEQLPQERLLVAVSNVAAMEFCLTETLRYVRDRSAFGRPIWGFQNTKFKMAEVATEARVARAFVDECIELHLDGKLDIPTAAMAKLWCSERAQRVADACLQAARRVWLHERVPHRPRLGRPARLPDLRRQARRS